jgi:hypothetical protein
MGSTNISVFKECFRNISIKDLNDNIANYHALSYSKNRSEESLRKELQKIFKVNINGEESTFFLRTDVITDENALHLFYRVKRFEPQDYKSFESQQFPSMSKQQDAWWKPEELSVQYGRLNRPNHSVLYVSSRISDAIYETGCRIGECFFLMVYKNIRRMRMSQIHKVD